VVNTLTVRTRSLGEVSLQFALFKQPVPSGCYKGFPCLLGLLDFCYFGFLLESNLMVVDSWFFIFFGFSGKGVKRDGALDIVFFYWENYQGYSL